MSNQAKNSASQVRETSIDVDIDPHEVHVDLSSVEGRSIESVEVSMSSKEMEKLAQNEKFMSEVLTVVFNEPSNENDFMYVTCGVNGRFFRYPRNGRPVPVPRYIVEVLARTRTQRTKTIPAKAADGSDTMSVTQVETLTYPFAVTREPSGEKGRRWLQQIREERLL